MRKTGGRQGRVVRGTRRRRSRRRRTRQEYGKHRARPRSVVRGESARCSRARGEAETSFGGCAPPRPPRRTARCMRNPLLRHRRGGRGRGGPPRRARSRGGRARGRGRERGWRRNERNERQTWCVRVCACAGWLCLPFFKKTLPSACSWANQKRAEICAAKNSTPQICTVCRRFNDSRIIEIVCGEHFRDSSFLGGVVQLKGF